jgi:hypothetical protein
MSYTLKPTTVEAFQMTQDKSKDKTKWPTWLVTAADKRSGEGALLEDPKDPEAFVITTLEGMMSVVWGDWIVKDAGTMYKLKAEVFSVLYQ